MYHAERARNFIVGVIAVAFFLFSQTWKSIPNTKQPGGPLMTPINYHSVSSLEIDIKESHASRGSGIVGLQVVGQKPGKAANKNIAAVTSAEAAGTFHCASVLSSTVAKFAAEGSRNGKQVMVTMLSNNHLDLFHSWLASAWEAGIKYILVGAMDSESALQRNVCHTLCIHLQRILKPLA